MMTRYTVIKSLLENLEDTLNDASEKGWKINQIIGPLVGKTDVLFLVIMDREV